MFTHRNTNVLNLLGGKRRTGSDTKAFHPSVCDAIDEDYKTLDEFSRYETVVAVWTRSEVP